MYRNEHGLFGVNSLFTNLSIQWEFIKTLLSATQCTNCSHLRTQGRAWQAQMTMLVDECCCTEMEGGQPHRAYVEGHIGSTFLCLSISYHSVVIKHQDQRQLNLVGFQKACQQWLGRHRSRCSEITSSVSYRKLIEQTGGGAKLQTFKSCPQGFVNVL